MSKTTVKAEHVAQLARMRRLCSELDDVREESERLYSAITAEARRASEAAPERNLAGGGLTRTTVRAAGRRHSAGLPRAIAN